MPRRAQSYSEIDQVLKIIKKAAKNNQNASKKRKIDEPAVPVLPQGSKYQDLREMKIKECQICGESGLIGFTDIYNISLREQSNNCLSFVEVVNYVLGISIQKGSSDICGTCKPKIIEYYHFKKRSQSIQKVLTPLSQEIMKIVNNYLNKNGIKAITIEESRESLIIMEKKSPEQKNAPTEERQSNLMISEVVEGIQIKKEPTDNEDDELVKQEFLIPPDAIKQEPADCDDIDTNLNECINMEEALANQQRENEELLKEMPEQSVQDGENKEENSPDEKPPEEGESMEEDAAEDKIDEILKINRQILSIIKNLDVKFYENASKNHSVLINSKCTIKEADSLTSNRPGKSESNT